MARQPPPLWCLQGLPVAYELLLSPGAKQSPLEPLYRNIIECVRKSVYRYREVPCSIGLTSDTHPLDKQSQLRRLPAISVVIFKTLSETSRIIGLGAPDTPVEELWG
jgi:hypothetical protein